MDASDREAYETTIAEAAAWVVIRIDCSADSVTAELKAALERLGRSNLVRQRADLILSVSDSPVAQSYRNARQADRDDAKWAGLALANDVQNALREDFKFRSGSSGISHRRSWLLSWQQEILRGDFPDDVPWSVIADWYDDHDDPGRANRCRDFESTIQ